MPIEGVSGEVHVELVWETPLVERLATGVSVLTFMALGAFLIDGLFLGGKVYERLAHRVKWPKKKEQPRGSVEWQMEAGVSAGEQDLMDSIATFSPVAGSTGGRRQRESLESGDPEAIEAMWMNHVESQKSSAGEDTSTERMIESGRRAREREDL
ncbi:MAG: hypothetical protein IIA89_15475 [Chloroflexi bacterium]|nr:hypothetical protein [Chloroflexota bacterium]